MNCSSYMGRFLAEILAFVVLLPGYMSAAAETEEGLTPNLIVWNYDDRLGEWLVLHHDNKSSQSLDQTTVTLITGLNGQVYFASWHKDMHSAAIWKAGIGLHEQLPTMYFPTGRIIAAAGTTDGKLYFGGDQGLFLLQKEKKWEPIFSVDHVYYTFRGTVRPPLPSYTERERLKGIVSMVTSADGKIGVRNSTNCLWIEETRSGRFKAEGSWVGAPLFLATGKGALYGLLHNMEVIRWEGSKGCTYERGAREMWWDLDRWKPTCFYAEKNSHILWAGALSKQGGQIARFSGRWHNQTEAKKLLGQARVNCFSEDSNGTIYVGTSKGILTYKEGVWSTFELGNRVRWDSDTDEPSHDLSVRCIYVDSKDRLWFSLRNYLVCCPLDYNSWKKDCMRVIDRERHRMKSGTKKQRIKAVKTLANIGNHEATQLLEIALKDTDTKVRRQAVAALGQVGGPEAVAILSRTLKHPSINIRLDAAVMLGTLRATDAVNALYEAMTVSPPTKVEDRSGIVPRCAFSLARMGESGIAALEKGLKHPNAYLRKCSVRALADTTNPTTLPLIKGHLQDPDAEVRLAALRALGNFKSPSVLPLLLERISAEDERIRASACLALQAQGDYRAIPKLIAELERRYSRIKDPVSRKSFGNLELALEYISGQRIRRGAPLFVRREDLEQIKRWWEQNKDRLLKER